MTASPKGSDALAVGRAARAARRATILIAEHTAEQAELLHLGLEAAGYSVLVARDGSEALAAAKAERPDAVVSDIELPGMDGYGLCRAIRSGPALASTPVILLTPLSDPLDVIRGLDAGADGYLTKPYDVPTLVARIEALLAAPPAPPPALERRRVQIHLGGETHSVDAHGPRLLNLLISTYENAMLQNRDLGAARRALDEVNEGLERKVRENTAAVAASENKYRRLFEAAQDGILLLELESGQIMDVNPFMIDLLGYTREQYLGKKLWEIGPFKDIAASKTAFAELQEKKYVRYEDLPLRTAHGKDIAVEFVSNVYEAGGLQVIQCNIRDVTARRQAERAQKLFRELVDRSSDIIEVVDPETLRYIDVNDTACQSLGYSRDELLSMRVHDIDAGLNPSAIESMNAQLRQSGSLEVESINRRKDGSTFPVEVRIKRIELGRTYNIVSIRDITERTQAQAVLERSARRNRKLIERGADVFFVIDASGAVTYRSPSGAQLTGWSDEEVVGKGITDHVTPEHLPAARQALAEAIRNPDMSIEIALQLRRKDGALRDIEITGRNLLADPDVNGIVLTARDITERKRAEQKILDSEAKFRGVVDQSLVAITIFQDGRYTYANHRALEMFGYGADEFMRLMPIDLVDEADRPRVLEGMRQRQTAQVAAAHYTFQGRRKDRALIDVEINGTSMELGGKRTLTAVMMDVTESRRAQRRAEESEAKLSAILGAVGDGVGVVDPQTRRLLSGTSAFCEMLGYRPEEIHKLSIADLHPAESLPSVMAQFARQITGEIKVATDLPVKRKDGSVFLADISTTAAMIGGKPQMVGVFHDVTGRKRAEEHLKRLNWALRALSQSNSALVHAGSEDELFRSCCAAIASAEGYALAWIGLARSDPGRSVKVVAAAGEALAYMQGLEVSAGDTPHGAGPAGRAIRSGATQVVENLAADSSYGPWLERAQAQGLVSGIVLPFKLENQVLGALAVYSREPAAFGADEVKLLEEMAGDIGYGIGTRRTRHAFEAGLVERARQAIKLRETLESAIGALAATVEQRDPYTAGHQRRVAGLAVAIGREMGFADDRLTGLHVAGTIHDIGKISVPAEILSRPGKLSSVEFELIKGHAQAGYEIIKGVDFPWPVAQAIWQHHERLDGSGYPRGLKGDQVILDARILAVADVVEAMSSHRPYRAGLGVDFALKEIEDKRGQLFDPAVVDACLRVFRERSFAFAS